MITKVILHLIAAIPALTFGFVTWRLVIHKEWVAYTITGLVTLACFLLHPASQMLADKVAGYPYAKSKEKLAIEYDIVGENYSYVVEKLGQPQRTRIENPTVLKTATREITSKNDTYQALDYFLSPALYTATRFIVFLDENGNVKSHRVKWEYGEGR